LQIGAGTGLLYLVRWFWWRVNAWCEVVAMGSSFLVSIALLVLSKQGVHVSTHAALLITIAVTTICWVATAYLGPQTDTAVLAAFYRKVRPAGPGWEPVRLATGLPAGAVEGDNIPLALVGWVAGCTSIWAALFAVGNFLYGRLDYAFGLLAVFVVSGVALIAVIRRLWSGGESSAA
jgi:SSS family solute:Na+ symporter